MSPSKFCHQFLIYYFRRGHVLIKKLLEEQFNNLSEKILKDKDGVSGVINSTNKNVNTSIKMDAIKINLANLENWPGSFLCMKNIAINPNET